jgi:23S rRNA (cytidine1920-2'-O)/16S rRNA (cytidine1409-2'-O)-methyltransferase
MTKRVQNDKEGSEPQLIINKNMKKRIDILLAEKGLAETRAKAQSLLMAGQVVVDGKKVDKAGTIVDENSEIEVKEKFPYVSRGALKIEKAHKEFKLNFKDKIICDIGASTGGFTDFALKNGAKKVYAIDVGYGQLDQKLREDERVVVMERTNIRDINLWEEFSKRVILASKVRLESRLSDKNDSGQARMTVDKINYYLVDVSFISLKKVLPVIKQLAVNSKQPAGIIALIKPQFEVGKKIADKCRGVIKDETIQKEVVENIARFAESIGFRVEGLTESPITGAKGNKEFLMWLESPCHSELDSESI